MPSLSYVGFKICTWTFAVLFSLVAAWILASEAVRPALPYFQTETGPNSATEIKEQLAGAAATLGGLRGDLWTDYALAISANLPKETGQIHSSHTDPAKEKLRLAAKRAAALSPPDPRNWLLLAQTADTSDKAAGFLKMSYYTGPNQFLLTPLRLHIALQPELDFDVEIKELASQEIRSFVRYRKDQQLALSDIYRDASLRGQQLIDTIVGATDPDLLAQIRSYAARAPR
jgi:hypothetical protein